MRVAGIFGLLFAVVASASTGELATNYQQAAQLAEAQEKAPATRDYFNQILLPHYAQKYAPVFQSCFASVKQPDNGPFSFVAAIGVDGRVVRLYEDQKTNISACALEALRNDTFPSPPQSPYYLHIEMKFTDAPASNGLSADAPPLLVTEDNYSYTFAVPSGWEFNFEQARQRGATLAFFPKGGSFADSSSIIYVNEVDDPCSGQCVSPVSQAIAKILREVKDDTPSVQVSTAAQIQTRDAGIKAEVRTLRGGRDPRNPDLKDNEAAAFIAHDETVILVVLTVRDPKTWEQDYAAFREIVAGHKFFTCNSPDLAVPCQK